MQGKSTIPARICPECGKLFTPKSNQRTYCGYGCSGKANQRKGKFLPVADRFWAKVRKSDEPDGCWEWTASAHGFGYGNFHIGGRDDGQFIGAHRYSYELAFGPIPDGLCVLHRCDNPPCVRPDHLFLGTRPENSQDAKAKGRMASGDRHSSKTHPEKVARGEHHASAKLTEALVLEIRKRAQTESQASIARSLDVSCATINDVVKGNSWKHVTREDQFLILPQP